MFSKSKKLMHFFSTRYVLCVEGFKSTFHTVGPFSISCDNSFAKLPIGTDFLGPFFSHRRVETRDAMPRKFV